MPLAYNNRQPAETAVPLQASTKLCCVLPNRTVASSLLSTGTPRCAPVARECPPPPTSRVNEAAPQISHFTRSIRNSWQNIYLLNYLKFSALSHSFYLYFLKLNIDLSIYNPYLFINDFRVFSFGITVQTTVPSEIYCPRCKIIEEQKLRRPKFIFFIKFSFFKEIPYESSKTCI